MLAHGQPVKVAEDWHDVIHSPCFCNQPGGRVLNTLNFSRFPCQGDHARDCYSSPVYRTQRCEPIFLYLVGQATDEYFQYALEQMKQICKNCLHAWTSLSTGRE